MKTSKTLLSFAVLLSSVQSFAVGVIFNPATLEQAYSQLAPRVYTYKAVVFRAASDLVSKLPPVGYAAPGRPRTESGQDRLFMLVALQPFIEDIHTDHFETEILPVLKNSLMTEMNFGNPTQLSEFSLNPTRLTSALKLAKAMLDASREFLPQETDQENAKLLTVAIGKALSQITPNSNSSDLVSIAHGVSQAAGDTATAALLETLEMAPRTAGIGRTMTAIFQYMGK